MSLASGASESSTDWFWQTTHFSSRVIPRARASWAGSLRTSSGSTACTTVLRDNIATIALKIDSIAAGVLPPGGTALQRAEAYFFQLADWMDQAGGPQSRLLDVRHEDLLAEPERELGRLAGFLGLDPDPAWLASCQAILQPEPHLTRRTVCWEAGQQMRILQRCGEYGFLSSYGQGEKRKLEN